MSKHFIITLLLASLSLLGFAQDLRFHRVPFDWFSLLLPENAQKASSGSLSSIHYETPNQDYILYVDFFELSDLDIMDALNTIAKEFKIEVKVGENLMGYVVGNAPLMLVAEKRNGVSIVIGYYPYHEKKMGVLFYWLNKYSNDTNLKMMESFQLNNQK